MSKYNLSICAVVKNEAWYLEEWLQFHLMMGVEHFYIYENYSQDATLDILHKYQQKSLVTLHTWPDNPIQFKAYQHCIDNYKKESTWVAFIDVDEFLWSPKYPSIYQALSSIETSVAPIAVGCIAARWSIFGSSDQKEKKDGLVIERFVEKSCEADKHVKSIARLEYTRSVGNNPHTFRTIGYTIDEAGQKLPTEYAVLEDERFRKHLDILQINHYHLKSYAEYMERKLNNPDPGTGKTPTKERAEEMFRAHDHSDCTDDRLLKYANKVRELINEFQKL